MEAFLGGKSYLMYGAMGTVTMPFNWGDTCVAEFTFRGIQSTISSDANPTGIAYPDKAVPPIFKSAAFNVVSGGTAYGSHELTSISVDIGNTVEVLKDANSTSNFKHAFISSRTSSASIDPYAVAPSDQNLALKLIQNGIANQASVEWDLGTAAGNKFHFQMPQGRIERQTDSSREGITVEEFRLVASGGNVYGTGGTELGQNMGSCSASSDPGGLKWRLR